MKRLYIDLDICGKCPECVVACSYFYHPQNKGVASVLEYATFATICRQCEDAPCVKSCYHDALEKQPDGVLKRYNMRCSSCKSCTIACPFGTILPEVIPYLSSSCDYCVGASGDKLPKCIGSCPHKAIELKAVKEDPQNNIYLIGDNLAVHSAKWAKKDPLGDRI
ncbi:MAG: 4Fe-4S dicluster domain-containing protein [Candidatus Omnitrophota bacterium]